MQKQVNILTTLNNGDKEMMVKEKLRQLAPGRIAVDPETGEVLEGPLKSSKSTYRITLARS